MCAFGERLGELRELAEDYATMPFGVRDVLAILLVGGLGCQREGGDAEVRAVGASFWVAAEKADEGYFVLVHDCLRLLNFPTLIGAPNKASGPCSQVPKLCIYGGSGEIFSAFFPNKIWRETVTRRAAQPKQKSELPQGA